MFENEPPQSGGMGAAFGGFFLGVVAGILIPIGVFGMVVSSFGRSGRWGISVAEILDLAILAGIGYSAYKNYAHSMFARGLVIGVSLAFLLNVICGIAMLGVR